MGLQVIAVPVVSVGTQLILQSPLAACEIRKWKPDTALTLVRCIVYHHQQSPIAGALPGEGDKAVACPVAIPSRCAFQQLPLAVAHRRIAENGQQPLVELAQRRVDGFAGAATKMR